MRGTATSWIKSPKEVGVPSTDAMSRLTVALDDPWTSNCCIRRAIAETDRRESAAASTQVNVKTQEDNAPSCRTLHLQQHFSRNQIQLQTQQHQFTDQTMVLHGQQTAGSHHTVLYHMTQTHTHQHHCQLRQSRYRVQHTETTTM